MLSNNLLNNLSDDNAYLLELKTINIFNSNVSRVYLFKSGEDA